MDYKEFARVIAGYESPNVERYEDGTINVEVTAVAMLKSVARLAQLIAPIDYTDSLAMAVCDYASRADNREIAEKAAHSLAEVLQLNELLNLYHEPLERMAAAGRWMEKTKSLDSCRSEK